VVVDNNYLFNSYEKQNFVSCYYKIRHIVCQNEKNKFKLFLDLIGVEK